MAPQTHRIDYHHYAQVFVKPDLTAAVKIRNETQNKTMTAKRAAFVSIMEKVEEALTRIAETPEE